MARNSSSARYDRPDPPRWVQIRDVVTGRLVLAQWDPCGRLFGLDEQARLVDAMWLARVFETVTPKK